MGRAAAAVGDVEGEALGAIATGDGSGGALDVQPCTGEAGETTSVTMCSRCSHGTSPEGDARKPCHTGVGCAFGAGGRGSGGRALGDGAAAAGAGGSATGLPSSSAADVSPRRRRLPKRRRFRLGEDGGGLAAKGT